LFSLFFLVPTILLGSLANPLFNGDPISFQNMEPAFEILPMFIVLFIVSGLGQELGWTGFLVARLQARYSAITARIIRAILVGIWHLPIFIYSVIQPQAQIDFQYAGWIAQKGFPVAVVTAILLFMLPWSIITTWIFNNTKGSLLLVSIVHGSEIWVDYWVLSTGINPSSLDNYWGYGAAMVLLCIIIVVINGPQNLSGKYSRIEQRLSQR
jgi:membrane protease YdiL (CAAX protease family)